MLCDDTADGLLYTFWAGGVRQVQVPAALAFGGQGTTLRPSEPDASQRGEVPPDADLIYRLELQRVSIPPS